MALPVVVAVGISALVRWGTKALIGFAVRRVISELRPTPNEARMRIVERVFNAQMAQARALVAAQELEVKPHGGDNVAALEMPPMWARDP
jgi:hypothetical protein